MKFDINGFEFEYLLKKGSSLQKRMFEIVEQNDLSKTALFELLDNYITEFDVEEDIRGWINGGVLFISENKEMEEQLKIGDVYKIGDLPKWDGKESAFGLYTK